MEAGDSDIAELPNLIAHKIGSDGGLFSYRKIAGSRADNRNQSPTSFLMIAAQHDAARNGMELGFGDAGLYGVELLAIRSRRQHIAVARGHSHKNLRHLLGSFAG